MKSYLAGNTAHVYEGEGFSFFLLDFSMGTLQFPGETIGKASPAP